MIEVVRLSTIPIAIFNKKNPNTTKKNNCLYFVVKNYFLEDSK